MRRVLIANRGEIAVRIIRGCHRLGLEAITVYSDADVDSPHVTRAEHAVRIGPEEPAESYLNIERVIAAARASGADAIHPGYGFLSERPDFAEACTAAGLVFVGPSAEAMRLLGDKARSKQLADSAGVPTVPSWAPDEVPDDAFPVLVKAAGGGGGRGMRVVDSSADLGAALESAAREAEAGFGDSTLIIEKLVRGARHVEVQLLADGHGTALYIGDRDCSLQRRHQKVIEEAPAPRLADDLHGALGGATTRLARAAGYHGAGTAEFLVGADGDYHFLELNARLQVEHPVTEEVFGIDLVEWQLRIARGERLTIDQHDVHPSGHAMEARIYAEDPRTFLPTGGRVLHLSLPRGVRVDHALREGAPISLAYDPLLAKIIAHGATRGEARTRLRDALRELALLGAITNQRLLLHALDLEAFAACTHSIETLEAHPLPDDDRAVGDGWVDAGRRKADGARGPFVELGAWGRSGSTPDAAAPTLPLHVVAWGDRIWVGADGDAVEAPRDHVDASGASPEDALHEGSARLTAPMPGTVIAAKLAGEHVRTGEPVVVLEAMKMENAIAAPFDGFVRSIDCSVGDLVKRGSTLAEVAR